jgi:hypothetical protein
MHGFKNRTRSVSSTRDAVLYPVQFFEKIENFEKSGQKPKTDGSIVKTTNQNG